MNITEIKNLGLSLGLEISHFSVERYVFFHGYKPGGQKFLININWTRKKIYKSFGKYLEAKGSRQRAYEIADALSVYNPH